MKLYYAPGACSLASRISLHEAAIAADFERVDLKSRLTERGNDFRALNPKGSVPMLVLDDGFAITENVAILDYIAAREPDLAPDGPLGRTRLIEMLAYLATELHPAFKPFWHDAGDAGKAAATAAITGRLALVEPQLAARYLLGPRFTVADAYLFVILRWTDKFRIGLSSGLRDYFERLSARSAVRQALAEEGLAERALA